MSSSWHTTDYPLQQLFTSAALTPTRMLSKLKMPPPQEMQLRLLVIKERAGGAVLSTKLGGAFSRSAWQIVPRPRGLVVRVVDLPRDISKVRGKRRLDIMDQARDELELILPEALIGLLGALVVAADEVDHADVLEYARGHGYYKP